MATRNQLPVTYKKNKVEISGNPRDVKSHIWFEQWKGLGQMLIAAAIIIFVAPSTVNKLDEAVPWIISIASVLISSLRK